MHKAVIANYAKEYTITYGIRLVEAAVSNIHIWHMFLHLNITALVFASFSMW